jgi:hypothetical protein
MIKETLHPPAMGFIISTTDTQRQRRVLPLLQGRETYPSRKQLTPTHYVKETSLTLPPPLRSLSIRMKKNRMKVHFTQRR